MNVRELRELLLGFPLDAEIALLTESTLWPSPDIVYLARNGLVAVGYADDVSRLDYDQRPIDDPRPFVEPLTPAPSSLTGRGFDLAPVKIEGGVIRYG